MIRPRCHRLCRECGALVAPSPAGARKGLTGKHLTSDGVTCAGTSVPYTEHPLRPELRSPPSPSPREQVAALVSKARVIALASDDEELRAYWSDLACVAQALVALASASAPRALPPGVISLDAYRSRRATGARSSSSP